MIENSLRENSTIVIPEQGIRPTLLLGNLPVNMANEKAKPILKSLQN